MKERIKIFDFDGTITNRDTLIWFIIHACGWRRFLTGFALHAPILVLMKLRLCSNYRAKQRIFKWFFGGMPVAQFNTLCRNFAADRQDLLRPEAVKEMADTLAGGGKVYIVSASIDNWVSQFAAHIAPHSATRPIVIGTRAEECGGRLTGRFITPNCYGAEKVRRIKDYITCREDFYIIAYGDSRGDKEMLEYADERHYKPFR